MPKAIKGIREERWRGGRGGEGEEVERGKGPGSVIFWITADCT